MLSLGFGLVAALAWAVHDLLVRRLAPGGRVLPLMVVVLAAGLAALSLPAVLMGNWQAMGPAELALSLGSGLAYSVGMGGLYKAFALAPVRVVAPVLGSFPMLSLAIAAAQGQPVGPLQWAAVVAIVGGIAWVALSGEAERDGQARPGPALIWATLGALGFAVTYALGQAAVLRAADPAAVWPVLWLTRASTLAVLVALALAGRAPLAEARPNLPTLALMGVLDALALGLVLASGQLPHPEYASVTSALFGMLTILLAWRVLGERVRAAQWGGIAVVFGGIAVLAALPA